MRFFLQGLLLIVFLPFYAAAQAPVASFTAATTQGCAPLLVQFTNTSTGTTSGTTYSWSFNNGVGTVVVQSPSTTFTTPGTYTVTLTVTNPGGGGSNTKTITNYITVLAPPAVSWTATDTTGCPPHAVTFNNTTSPASGLTYFWSFGDGQTSPLKNPTHNYTASNTYNVTLVATNANGCSRTVVRTGNVKIWSKPQIFFSGSPATLCSVPATVAFSSSITAGLQPYTYDWSFGNGNNSALPNPTTLYNSAGPFTVRLIVTDARGCIDTSRRINYIQSTNTQANFTAPTVCAGAPLTFNNTSLPVPTAAEWNFGAGAIPATSTAINPTTTFALPGTYSVRLITTGTGGCKDTTIKTVTISGGPTVAFSATPTNPCSVPAVVNFTNTTSGATSFQWIFGDGSTSTATNPTHTYNSYGIFTDTLIATSAVGCTTRLIKPQHIQIREIVSKLKPSTIEGCVPLTVDFKHELETGLPTPSPVYPFPITSYSWNFGLPGANSTAAQPTYTFTAAGTYKVKVTSLTANGCTVIDSVTIKVGTLPVAGFTYAPPVQCTHQPIQFTNTSTGAQYYQWEMGDGASLNGTNPSYSYPTPGTYTVLLKAFNNGCADTFKVLNAVTINPPNATFVPSYSCDTPRKVAFVNQAMGATSQSWLFGDGTGSSAAQPVHTYAALGTYTVRLVTFNSTFGCSDTSEKTIVLTDGTTSFVANDTAVCTGDTVHFTGSFAGGTALEYKWGREAGGIWTYDTSGATISFPYPTRGKFGVRLIIFDGHSCPDTFTRAGYITVARPLVGFKVSDTAGCVPFKPLFTDTSKNAPGVAAALRNWKWGNAASSLTPKDTISYTYNTPGNYTVTLTVTDSVGCTDSLTKVAYVKARKPAAAFTINDTSACIGQSLTFTNTTVGTAPYTALWSFGSMGATSPLAQPSYAYSATGSYNVKLVVTDAAGCKDSLTKPAAVTVTRPTASFTASDSQAICPPLLVSFANTSTNGAVAFDWNFGNSSFSVLPNPSTVYTAIGQYGARLIVSNAQGCKDTAVKTIKILGFAGALTYTPLLGCVPLQVQLTANVANVPSLIWDFDDGITTTATGTTISHTYTTPGSYIPRLLISDGNGCVTSSTGLDTIKADGVRPGFKWSPACLGSPIVFTDTSKSFFSNISSRSWRFPGGGVLTTPNPTYSASGSGSFSVVLISKNANGCTDSITRVVTVTPPPAISAGGDTAVCLNDAVPLLATGGLSYVWSPAFSLNNAAIPNPLASPLGNTSYTVVGTDGAGCTGTDTVFVRVKTKTTATTGGDAKVCKGSAVQLTGGGGTTYSWSPAGSLDNAASASPLASPGETTVYTLIAREGSCIPDTVRVRVTVNPRPNVSAGTDVNLISGGTATLVASSTDAEIFSWSPPAGLACLDCSATGASPAATTTYKVTGTNRYGCSDSDEVTVFVQCNGNQIFVPNTFTPNGDGENDVFYPHGNGITQVLNMRVYNRWGEVVFQRSNFAMNDRSAGWDGTFKGEQLSPDAFIYTIDAQCPNGETINWKGDVTLIR